jgi:flagellin
MVDSINNSTGVLGALRYLQSSGQDITAANSRLSSGLKVGKASDGASAYQTAAVMKGEQGSLNAVALSLSHAHSVSDIAIAGGEQVSKLLTTMRDTAAQAMSADLTTSQRQALDSTFATQKQQLTEFIKSASFDDANLLDGSRLGGVTFIADAAATQVLTLAGRDFNMDGTVVTLASTQTIDTAVGAQQAYTMLTDSITNVGSQLTQMSGESKRVQAQIGFVSKLADALAGGVGRLVDTDLPAESALIQALQVRQQLSAHALGIVNDAPQALLSLFRPA